MKPEADNYERQDQIIAGLLWYGTWLATALIAVGVLLIAAEPFLGPLAFPLNSDDAVKIGVAAFILLPVARVVLMLTIFLRQRDYLYTAIAALVLAIIAVGVLIQL